MNEVNGAHPGAPGVERHEVAILGAGFAGLAMAHHLRRVGIDDFVIFERDDGVGGTWRANSYPGAACDVPSHLYSLSFAPKPDWSRTYATQPEILSYIEECFDRFDLRPNLRLSTTIVAATWNEVEQCWRLRDDNGIEYEATVLVSAIGLFHSPVQPAIEGIDEFEGTVFHSARWNHDHDLAGRQVAVIGTGASAIQIVPAIAETAERLTVYQRTPAWILPRRDKAFTDDEKARFARRPLAERRHRWQIYRQFEKNTTFRTGDPAAAEIGQMALGYLAHKVPDPDLRAKLTPGYPIGCKRVLVSSDFYPAVQRDDVELVTETIERVTPNSIVTADGVERPCDTIVACTGFRATDYLRGIDVVGTGSTSLHEHWAGVPGAYLGMAVPGYPNFFMLYGPNTNQGGNSIIFILEAQAHYVAAALRWMQRRRASRVQVRASAMERYDSALQDALASTVWSGCDSYFRTGAGDIVTQLPHPSRWYWWHTRRVARRDFTFRS